MNKSLLSASLLDPQPLAPVDTTRSQRPSICSFMSEDLLDGEWKALEKKLAADQRAALENEETIRDAFRAQDNLDSMNNLEAIRGSVTESEAYLKQINEYMTSLRSRLLRDLSVSVKLALATEYGLDSQEANDISNISADEITELAELEQPQCHEWDSWIQNKITEAVTLPVQ